MCVAHARKQSGKMCGFKCITFFICIAFHSVNGYSRCEKLVALSTSEDKQTVVDTNLKLLAGTWISEGCETRPGPEYVIRYYEFEENGNFSVIQHHYWDESCSSPKLTLTATGRLQLRNSLVQPGASNGYTKIGNITVIPHDIDAAKMLDRLVASECAGQYWKTWRRYEEHLVYENKHLGKKKNFMNWSSGTNFHSLSSQRNVQHSSGHITCLGSLKWAFNELKLLKIQLRPFDISFKKPKEMKMELLLGDIHSNLRLRGVYNPTSFQTPLVKRSNGELVTINRRVYSIRNANVLMSNIFTNSKTPPHLLVKAPLPPYIWGEWTSVRCEIRPMGLYLTRLFYFYSEDSTWIGEHKFYSDPFCTIPKFVVTAAGFFQTIGPSYQLGGSYDIDFHIEKASMTILDQRMTQDFHLPGVCGLDEWEVNVPKELSSTNGCLPLGIILPSVQMDIMKIEMSFKGALLLYLGQTDTDNMPDIAKNERPTAFQLPLVKCGEISTYSQELRDILYDDLDLNTGNIEKVHLVLMILSLVLVMR